MNIFQLKSRQSVEILFPTTVNTVETNYHLYENLIMANVIVSNNYEITMYGYINVTPTFQRMLQKKMYSFISYNFHLSVNVS